MLRTYCEIVVGLLLLVSVCCGWSGHDVTQGNVRLVVDEIADVRDPSKAIDVTVRVMNIGRTLTKGRVEIRELVDEWRVVGRAADDFALAPGKEQSFTFEIVSGPFVFEALYPVHAYATVPESDATGTVHAVRVFRVASVPQPLRTQAFTAIEVPSEGAVSLLGSRRHRAAWRPYDGDMVLLGPGWSGSDPRSRATVAFETVTRGDARRTLTMHPPWGVENGTVFCDYLVDIPVTKPITLTFANAIRDHGAKEPPSDGVLFRVWVGRTQDGIDAKEIFASFTDSKTWKDGRVDLSPFAGQTVLLRLESHPGPKRNTTCDSSYWGEPMIVAGMMPADHGVATAEEMATARMKTEQSAQRLARKGGIGDRALSFELQGAAAVVACGPHGLLDGVVAVARPDAVVSFEGFLVDLDGMPVGAKPSAHAFKTFEIRPTEEGVAYIHHLNHMGTPVELVLELRGEGPVLRAEVSCSRRITRFCVGAWSRKALAVYYGHGYCIKEPEPFRAGFGGHNLASSHVGCDFEGGMSVLQASDAPPDAFTVDPRERVYALETHTQSTISLVPGESAFTCAVAYRPYYDKTAAPAVARLAGRFCFDIWGGRYVEIADRMQQMIDYGLTDAFITIHNWQRWGYDYRLPDIYPPNPDLGSVADMKRIGDVCRAHDIPWGLHDNYIDFYPDAKDYSYRHVYFTENGVPNRAWFNQGRDALSYKWRPDRILSFVKRNYGPIQRELNPSHCFIDVFTSQGCDDWWDCEGNFHSSKETRKHWGEAFAYIREVLGNNAPTTSEAGHDQLIGYLDGADCQWLTLSPEGRRHMLRVSCQDWERVPWYDAVNHHRFVLHGVGYSTRYQGERPREAHGINSDDYISAEILSGHALMVDSGCWGRHAVRKYYLAQDVARAVALAKITNLTFADDDMHRQRVTWDCGAVATVNRGKGDWKVQGRVLPQFGFLVEYGNGYTCSVDRDADGFYRESSCGPSGWYCNARSVTQGQYRYQIEPHIEDFTQTGPRTFEWTMVWDAREPTPTDHHVYVHFCMRDHYGHYGIRFQDDHAPSPATSTWGHGQVRTKRSITIPAGLDGDIRCAVGLHAGGHRLVLGGRLDGESRVVVATLKVGKGEGDVPIDFTPPAPVEPLPPTNWNPLKPSLDFGFAVTDGAFRIQRNADGLSVIPLPESPPFSLQLNVRRLGCRSDTTVRAVRACALNSDTAGTAVEYSFDNARLQFKHDGETQCYRVILKGYE